jgi:DNA-binding LacI/PurR family transcriptional regulator
VQLGRLAISALIASLDGRSQVADTILPTALEIRGTTGPPVEASAVWTA